MDTIIRGLENGFQLTGLSGIRCGSVKVEMEQPRWRADKTLTQRLHFIIAAPFKVNQPHHRFWISAHARENSAHADAGARRVPDKPPHKDARRLLSDITSSRMPEVTLR